MAEILPNTSNDIGNRGCTNTTLAQFKGKPRQVLVNIEDAYRLVVMDGSTLGGKFKAASLDELNSVKNTANSALTKTLADDYYLAKTGKATTAGTADRANALTTARSIGITGAVTGAGVSFNGTANININTTAVDGTKVSTFTAATASIAGTIGAVPAPSAGAQAKFLRGDGTWQVPTNTDTKVVQTPSTTAGEYALLAKDNTGVTTTTSGSVFNAGVTVNPNTKTITATTFKGSLHGNATSATKATNATKASQDASGNDIPTTYATKAEVNTELAKKQAKGDYATNTALKSGLGGKANRAHTHTVSQITDMPKVVLSVNDITPDDSGNVKVGALPLGHLFAWPFQTPPDGAIQCNGATYNRALYKDFFAYATSKGWVKTEAEWQSIASANGGYCPYYSQGDGSTTFRTPKFAPFMQVDIASANVGKYRQAGLPNIKGRVYDKSGSNSPAWTVNPEQTEATGAFRIGSKGGYTSGGSSQEGKYAKDFNFDASRSNAIYGRSTTVQPESHAWMICVVVAGQATNLGSVDVSNVMSAVAQVQADVENIQANMPPRSSVYVKEIWKSGTEWRRIFSDGWIEQGGILKGNSGTVSFHKGFSNTDYTFLHTPNLSSMSGQWFEWGVSSKTTTSIKIGMGGGANTAPSSMCWVAYGY